MKRYWTIAHRGFNAKDNSERAIQNAIKANFDVIEVDIQQTLDNHIVLQHDLFLKGHQIEQTPLHVLQEIDPELITIDRFWEIIHSLPKQKKIEVLFHVKGGIEIVGTLMNFLETKVDEEYRSKILISSFQKRHIDAIKQFGMKVAGVGMVLCNDFLPQEIVPYIEFVAVDINILSSSLVNTLREQNLVIFVFTCKCEQECQMMRHYDVDGIITDILL